MKLWNALKKKWKVETDKRMIWIFIVFAITGSSTVVVRKYIFQVLGIDIEHDVLAFIVKLIAIYIVYQFLLFLVGTIMGEGKFVRWFLVKMNARLIGKKME